MQSKLIWLSKQSGMPGVKVLEAKKSYKEIVRSSSIIGGSQVFIFVVALIRTKIVALLLGPSGIGLVGIYSSAMTVIGAATGFGISSSAVREVAHAYKNEDGEQVARTVTILQRACWVTGIFGWLIAVLIAKPVSQWMMGTPEYGWALAVLGVTLLIGAINSGQLALLQGSRRIGDIARANMLSAAISTFVAVGLYAWLAEGGIVPVIIASGAVSLASSYWFARKVKTIPLAVSWVETVAGTRRMARLGIAFMWSALLTSGLEVLTRAIVSRELGLDAVGIYQAAWTLSGLFAGFILGAMGADFYPRLASVAADSVAARRLVNEQTEIGILLALPGLLGTLAFAPVLIEVIFSSRFVAAADLLPWMVLGVFCRVVGWPMGYVQVAKGASRLYIATETFFAAATAVLLFVFIASYGVVGAAYAFALAYVLYVLGMLWVARVLIDFGWSSDVIRLLCITGFLVGLGILISIHAPSLVLRLVAGGAITVVGTLYSARGLVRRLGTTSRLVSLASWLPGGRWLLGL
ncbi:MAG: O-antigen translocase [Pseudomonadota bacterium]